VVSSIPATENAYSYEFWREFFEIDEGQAALEDMRILVSSLFKHGLMVEETVINPHNHRPVNSACLDRLVEIGELEQVGWTKGVDGIRYRSFKRRALS